MDLDACKPPKNLMQEEVADGRGETVDPFDREEFLKT